MSYVLSGEPRTNSLLMQQNFSALPERERIKKVTESVFRRDRTNGNFATSQLLF